MGGRKFARKIEYALIAQSAERVLGKDEVTSSNLVKSSIKNPHGVRLCGFSAFIWDGMKTVILSVCPPFAPHKF